MGWVGWGGISARQRREERNGTREGREMKGDGNENIVTPFFPQIQLYDHKTFDLIDGSYYGGEVTAACPF